MADFHHDLNNLTRDFHDKSWVVEYMKKNPLVGLMLERKNLRFKGGKRYFKNLDTDTHEDLTQDYAVNQPLSHGVKDTSDTAYFRKKKFQHPIQIDVDEELENAKQTSDGTQLQNLAKYRVRKANESVRTHLRILLYRRNGHTNASTDTNKFVQGISQVLTPDVTYGTLVRTRGSNVRDWWQPADNQFTATEVTTTAAVIGIHQLRTWYEPMEDIESDNTDIITIMGGVLWLSLQAEAEVRAMPYKIMDNRVTKQGFTEMILDGKRIIKDGFLKSKYNSTTGIDETTGNAGALEKRLLILNLKDWDMFIHPDRNFRLTDFFDQKKIANGSDFELARVLFAGNLVCWKPNSQLELDNVTP